MQQSKQKVLPVMLRGLVSHHFRTGNLKMVNQELDRLKGSGLRLDGGGYRELLGLAGKGKGVRGTFEMLDRMGEENIPVRGTHAALVLRVISDSKMSDAGKVHKAKIVLNSMVDTTVDATVAAALLRLFRRVSSARDHAAVLINSAHEGSLEKSELLCRELLHYATSLEQLFLYYNWVPSPAPHTKLSLITCLCKLDATDTALILLQSLPGTFSIRAAHAILRHLPPTTPYSTLSYVWDSITLAAVSSKDHPIDILNCTLLLSELLTQRAAEDNSSPVILKKMAHDLESMPKYGAVLKTVRHILAEFEEPRENQ